MSFNRDIEEILRHEGGYVNHPHDPGGATNKGITIGTYRRYVNREGSIQDLKNMSTEQAVKIYKKQYWDKVRADELPKGLGYAMADFAVNSGPKAAIKILQEILGVAKDGRLGPNTLKAVKERDTKDLINSLCDRRLVFMKSLRNKETRKLLWDTFGRGWLRRVERVRSYAISSVETEKAPEKTNSQGLFLNILLDIINRLVNKNG